MRSISELKSATNSRPALAGERRIRLGEISELWKLLLLFNRPRKILPSPPIIEFYQWIESEPEEVCESAKSLSDEASTAWLDAGDSDAETRSSEHAQAIFESNNPFVAIDTAKLTGDNDKVVLRIYESGDGRRDVTVTITNRSNVGLQQAERLTCPYCFEKRQDLKPHDCASTSLHQIQGLNND